MEVCPGQIVNAEPGFVTVRVPYDNWERFARCLYEECAVGFVDGRRITPEQRRKVYALLGEVAAWSGLSTEDVKLTTKRDFIAAHLEGLQREIFSLSDCDVTTARGYIDHLVTMIIQLGIPCSRPLVELCDDVPRYVYACCTHKVCAVCGQKADLHHVDRVGMGRNRDDIMHIGMECLPLCRAHHMEAHQHGDVALLEKYHLETVTIDAAIAKHYHLKGAAKHEKPQVRAAHR